MINLVKNETVYYRGAAYAVHKVKDDLVSVLIRSKTTHEIQKVPIAELSDKAPDSKADEDPRDLAMDAYSEEALKEAERKLAIIKPFLGEMRGDKAALIRTAKANELSKTTLYEWISKFDTYGHVGALVDRHDMKGGKGKGRLDEKTEEIIAEVIYEEYMESKSFDATYRKLKERLTDVELKVPHENSIRWRIKNISENERIRRRLGPRTAAQQFDAKPGTTPHATSPLSLVQIDHTQLDVMLVDEKERQPFKRPWITVLIDVFSRVILGFYISFDPPSAFGVGRAIAHAVLRKEKFLADIGLSDVEWACWGKMATLMCDNAKEFRGNMLKESCAHYKITLKWRPPKKPEFGGHIERLMGTIAEELKDLSGTTKVSKELRAKFKPEKTASFTLSEFEKWFTVWVTGVYHTSEHRGIDGQQPIEKWKEGILGSAETPGIGMPEVIVNAEKLRMDLLPQFKRTIQRTGVHLLNFRYFSGILRKWVNARDEAAKGRSKPKRQFIFKFDPRDISSVLFLDPADNQYHLIPTTLNLRPDKMSIWQHRQVIQELRKNRTPINETNILTSYRRMNALEQDSKKRTQDAKKNDERNFRQAQETPLKVATETTETPEPDFKTSTKKIMPYDEIELYTPSRLFK